MHEGPVDVPAFVALRAAAGMTMAELARRSGVSYSLIKYVQAGERQFSDVTALKIAHAMGCHPDDFTVSKVNRRRTRTRPARKEAA